MNIKLQDPITKAFLIASDHSGNTVSGGWTIWVSSYNKIFDKVRLDPNKFVGMVFREITPDNSVRFVRITQCLYRLVPNPKLKGYPDIEYFAIHTEVIKDTLDATEKIEQHEKLLDTLNDTDETT
jgi:hypothetical protein